MFQISEWIILFSVGKSYKGCGLTSHCSIFKSLNSFPRHTLDLMKCFYKNDCFLHRVDRSLQLVVDQVVRLDISLLLSGVVQISSW